ncbi:MAG: HEAT repeat domain-containing protein [Candidatus Latescibacterota bacterium]|nr:MAG: HEAT repeat domain-containing protein [Candidatus Latescibacterota bacterium]
MRRFFLATTILAVAAVALSACSGGTPQEKSIARKIKTLETYDYDKYRATIKELGEAGPVAVRPLLKGLKSRDESVRCGCAEALGKIGDNRAVEPLIKKLKDRGRYEIREGFTPVGGETVAACAADALGDIGDRRAVEPLLKLLVDRDPSHREAAAGALGKIKDERAVGPLVERVNDRYYGITLAASDALYRITGVDHHDSYEAWKEWYRKKYGSDYVAKKQ